jgi:hypothetical protein
MNAGEQAEVRPVSRALRLEARKFDFRERLRVEADRAPLDQPTCPSSSTSGACSGGRSPQAK